MSRRHRIVLTKPTSESDLDGTTNGVAGVTLDSDNLSENSGSLKTKKRRRLRKRPASQMDWQIQGTSGDEKTSGEDTTNEGHDADDEQSDWPESNTDVDVGTSSLVKKRHVRGDLMETTPEPDSASEAPPMKMARFAKPALRCRDQANGAIPPPLKRRIERFLNDTVQEEMSISHTYRIAAIRRLVNRPEIEVIKRPRGTIVLRKNT
ncbi:unnamed protein product [Bursaphelenchus okinawaensis]|uniref:Uncharacterized protein n=1 Tax=Bursaphelenchus okinawaensis TaxID=465554 RepID=A0A811L3B6_9BILA|nr:unnamed protein product [Bursaphelenchus okinawaensis]CAG9115581.1 unnamed protein product [Bursaphelenchus okinawaensis]